ncbi:GNAT family N-acetyltransferase [Stenotrophomonas bentonitica]|uniref:GNAT family N-acetyltransferase n=1 Tax=Stenotrophomonas bentonitica TaxID=1450134 RepID=UPI0037CDF068
MRLRVGRADEADRLWVLRTRCVRELCSTAYPPEVIAPWSASPPPQHYRALLAGGGGVIAEDAEGALLGYGVIDLAGNEIDALFVDPDCGGRGIGLTLMQAMEALADPARPLVLSASLNAVPFYQRCGFEALREESCPHPSGVALASVRMQRTR